MGGSQSSPTTFFVVNTAGETLPMRNAAARSGVYFPVSEIQGVWAGAQI